MKRRPMNLGERADRETAHGNSYFDYSRQVWVTQEPGEREIVRVDAQGSTYYADGDVERPGGA